MNRKRLAALLLILALCLTMLSGTALASKKKKKAKATPTPAPVVTPGPDEQALIEVTEDGEYSLPEEVAVYLYTFEKLPANFITKNQARKLGWDSSRGNLWQVAPGKSIGGDRFGNYEGLLPEDGDYRECDVNYEGGYRQAERIIFDVTDWDIYYTNDHYATFTQLYGYDEYGEFYAVNGEEPKPSPTPAAKNSKKSR